MEIGSTVTPSLPMGLREVCKLGESFLGMEVGGGAGFTSSHGYEFSTKSEVLFIGTDQVQERGMSGRLSYDSASNGLGVQLSVVPERNRCMQVARNTLWGDSVLDEDFDSSMHISGAQINVKIGYGLTVWEDLGLLNPYGGVLLSENQEDKYRVSTKFSLGSGIEFGLEHSQILKDDGSDENEFKLDGSITWLELGVWEMVSSVGVIMRCLLRKFLLSCKIWKLYATFAMKMKNSTRLKVRKQLFGVS